MEIVEGGEFKGTYTIDSYRKPYIHFYMPYIFRKEAHAANIDIPNRQECDTTISQYKNLEKLYRSVLLIVKECALPNIYNGRRVYVTERIARNIERRRCRLIL